MTFSTTLVYILVFAYFPMLLFMFIHHFVLQFLDYGLYKNSTTYTYTCKHMTTNVDPYRNLAMCPLCLVFLQTLILTAPSL
jgi:hypothetical protein